MPIFYIIVGGAIIVLAIFTHVASTLMFALLLVLIGGVLYDFYKRSHRSRLPHEHDPFPPHKTRHSAFFREKDHSDD